MVVFFSLVVGVWLYMYYVPEPPQDRSWYEKELHSTQEWHPDIR